MENTNPQNAAAPAGGIDQAAAAAPAAIQPPPAPAAAPEAAATPAAPATPTERLSRDKALLRKSEREAGRRKLLEKLNREAKALGFESHDALVAAYRASREKEAAAAKPADPAAPPKEDAPSAASEERVTALQKQVSLLEQESGKLQRQIRVLRREMETRELVYGQGAKDVKYVTNLFAEAARKEGFDADTFFKNLKKNSPYLFNQGAIESRPATTVADTSPAPTPGSSADNKPPRKRVKEMSKAEYAKWKAENVGVRHPFG